jgi:hypothetical protein
LDARPATKRKTASGRKLGRKLTVKRRDGLAVALQGAQYRKRVVGSAKAYNRKAKAPPPEDVSE